MLNIFLTNLGLYNEGVLAGEWVSLPVSDFDLEAVKIRIGVDEYHEETFITDYETDIHGVKVGEYDSIDDLNELAEALEDDDAAEIIGAMLEAGYTFEEAMQKYNDGEYTFYSGCSDMAEVAEQYADETGLLESIPERLRYYFDFEALGRDMNLEGQYNFTDGGCVEIF